MVLGSNTLSLRDDILEQVEKKTQGIETAAGQVADFAPIVESVQSDVDTLGTNLYDTTAKVNQVINVTYAVRGANDGVTDDTTAILSKIEDAQMTTPGPVILEDEHKIDGTIVAQPGIPLLGRGAGVTRLTSGGSNAPGLDLPDGGGHEVGGFTLVGRGAGAGFSSQHAITGNDIRDVLLQDLVIEDWPARGVFFARIENLRAERLTIRRITEAGAGLGGNGIWIFDASGNLFFCSILTEDIDASGIVLDSGSPPLGGGQPLSWHISDVVTRRTGRARHAGAITFEGGARGTLKGAVIEDTGTAATLGVGVVFATDQLGAESNDITASDVVMDGVSGAAAHFRGTKRNTLSNWRIHNVQRDLVSGDGQAFDFRAYTDTLAVVHEATDNFLELIRVTQDAGVGLYKYGAFYYGAGTQRNRGRNNDWGTPTTSVVGYASSAPSAGHPGTAGGVDNGNGAGARRQGQASVSNTSPANRIYHTLGTTPRYWQVQSTIAGHVVTATANSIFLEVSLQDNAGAAVGVAETVVWQAEV